MTSTDTTWRGALLLGALGTMVLGVAAAAPVKNGFDLAGALVPPDEIHQGGPPRDGIPALDAPGFVAAGEATWLDPGDRVLGIERNGEVKAYPIGILNWHEIVNDRVGGEAIAVTFCPLCGTGMAFEADIGGEERSFGVSGLLYNSDVLLYDRQSGSLWSQIGRQAVSGALKGERLTMVAVAHTTWADWRSRHPDTRVLSRDTGHARNYDRNPYAGYESAETVWFPVANRNNRYHPKEQVIGLEVDGRFKAYPFSELSRSGTPVDDEVGGTPVRVEFSAEHRTGRVLDVDGQEIPTVIAFWFAWTAFHPETDIYVTTGSASTSR